MFLSSSVCKLYLFNTFYKLDTEIRFTKLKKLCSFSPLHGIRDFHRSAMVNLQAKLTPQEVTDILRNNEYTKEFEEDGSIKSYDSNQLASNSPIEDTHCEAKCSFTTGTLFGVFDGHAGPACAQVISKRLFKYICVSLLPLDLLNQYLAALKGDEEHIRLINTFNNKFELLSELKILYKQSFIKYVEDLIKERNHDFNMADVLKKACLKLDADISEEAINTNKNGENLQTLGVAMSGAVSLVAHIDGPHLHIANTGDCQAVLGTLTDENSWIVKRLTSEHSGENDDEVNRIRSEHPIHEQRTVIRNGRLFGQLAPLRAFGDVRFKWSVELLTKIVAPYFGKEVITAEYQTPPYLTACPDITHHRLTPRDKFLIIASDGLWEFLTPLQAVQLVGEHMFGKVTLSPFRLPNPNMCFKDINRLLLERKQGLNMKPIDSNAATHLLRNAFGSELSNMLSLPKDVSRFFRDDMTITIVYFNTKYLRQFHY